MKKLLHNVLLPLCLTGASLASHAADNDTFNVDSREYRVLNESQKTVELKYDTPFRSSSLSTKTTYNLNVIPEKVSYNDDEYTVVSVGPEAFKDNNAGTIVLPRTVKKIGARAFQNCMDCIKFYGSARDYRCYVYIKSTDITLDSEAFSKTSGTFRVYAPSTVWDKLGKNDRTAYPYIETFDAQFTPDYFSFNTAFSPCESVSDYAGKRSVPGMFNSDEIAIDNIKVQENHINDPHVEPLIVNSKTNNYTISNLYSGYEYKLEVYWHYVDEPEIVNNFTVQSPKTNDLEFEYKLDATQSTVTISDFKITTSDAPIPQYTELSINNQIHEYTGQPIKFTNLPSGVGHLIHAYMTFEDGKATKNIFVETKPIEIDVIKNIGPTSAELTVSIEAGDANVAKTYWNNEENPGNKITITGLNPRSSLNQTFYVVEENKNRTAKKVEFTTPALELKTLQPKGVSSTCSIVAAETNISDYETNVGFQWKKYDAPASLAPSEGYAAIYDGMLEGYLRNLQPTSYYNVRAFYKSADGNYYYGDWVTFDPSDFSYFEPTVHTYAVSDINHNSAQVRGYVIAGTDDIDEQGFEYWPMNNVAKVKSVAGAPEQGVPVTTILAKGQVMTATLTDLEPETTYTCRAFVKTAAGITYGEEQTFSTESDPSGIEAVAIDGKEVKVAGYYDISGRRYDVPQRGMNIIVYTDGTARKVIVK